MALTNEAPKTAEVVLGMEATSFLLFFKAKRYSGQPDHALAG
ncbi:MAG: hypothetical protein ACOH2D_13295 [Gelidibacter sp.]